MKAAVLAKEGTVPTCVDFTDPIPENDEQVLINIKAASITQLDILKASGKHYTHYSHFPIVVGLDGIGVLEDGSFVYAAGITGMIGEKALVRRNTWSVLPDNIDLTVAAGLPNALVGAGVALIQRAKIQPKQTILINGCTGLTGKVAVQLARYYDANRIIGVGRNPDGLASVMALGANEVVSLNQNDTSFIQQIKKIHEQTPIDIVIDYLWGHPVEMILTAFQHMPYHPVKLVTVGEMAGADITLPSAFLRSSPIEILGSGMGSFTRSQLMDYMKNILPAMFKLAAEGQLIIDVETIPLTDVESGWGKKSGKALVVLM
jgi:NADPH:quinone reductase-like Zn-dependent oxidoreductase